MGRYRQRPFVVSAVACCSLLVLPGLVCPLFPIAQTPSSNTSTNTETSSPGAQGVPGTGTGTPGGQNAISSQTAIGPQGPAGPTGPQGPAGPSAFTAGAGIQIIGGQISVASNFTDGLYWRLGGNSGTTPLTQFIGTTDNQPFELHANGVNVLRLNANRSARFDLNNGHMVTFFDDGNNLITTTANTARLTNTGNWINSSDRTLKTNFQPIDRRVILEKLVQMPVQQWNYKTGNPAYQHIGPTAQDFANAFGLGDSDTSINTLDADGVSMAAIQGLYDIVQDKQRQIDALEARISRLEAALGQ